MPTSHLLHLLEVSKETLREIEYIRRLRNQTVHGIERPNENELLEAGKKLEHAIKNLNDLETETKKKRKKPKSRAASKSKRGA